MLSLPPIRFASSEKKADAFTPMVQEPGSYGLPDYSKPPYEPKHLSMDATFRGQSARTVLDYCDGLSGYEARRRIKANPLLAHFQSLS